MFRIARSLVMIVAVLAVAAGVTGAYFSSSVTSSGNTFATGTMRIEVNDQNPTATAVFNETNLAPGDVISERTFVVDNVGTIDGNHLDLEVTLSGDTALAQYIVFDYNAVTNPNALRFGATQSPSQSVSLDRDYYPAGDTEYALANGGDGAQMNMDRDNDGKVTLWDLAQMKTRITPGTYFDGIAQGSTATLWMNANVDPALTTQGQSVTATFTWTLHQDASQY